MKSKATNVALALLLTSGLQNAFAADGWYAPKAQTVDTVMTENLDSWYNTTSFSVKTSDSSFYAKHRRYRTFRFVDDNNQVLATALKGINPFRRTSIKLKDENGNVIGSLKNRKENGVHFISYYDQKNVEVARALKSTDKGTLVYRFTSVEDAGNEKGEELAVIERTTVGKNSDGDVYKITVAAPDKIDQRLLIAYSAFNTQWYYKKKHAIIAGVITGAAVVGGVLVKYFRNKKNSDGTVTPVVIGKPSRYARLKARARSLWPFGRKATVATAAATTTAIAADGSTATVKTEVTTTTPVNSKANAEAENAVTLFNKGVKNLEATASRHLDLKNEITKAEAEMAAIKTKADAQMAAIETKAAKALGSKGEVLLDLSQEKKTISAKIAGLRAELNHLNETYVSERGILKDEAATNSALKDVKFEELVKLESLLPADAQVVSTVASSNSSASSVGAVMAAANQAAASVAAGNSSFVVEEEKAEVSAPAPVVPQGSIVVPGTIVPTESQTMNVDSESKSDAA